MIWQLWLTGCAAVMLAAGAARGGGEGGQVNLLVMGDWGYPMDGQKTAAAGMVRYAQAAKLRFDAVLAPGDCFKKKPGSDQGEENMHAGFEKMYDAAVLPMPFYAVVGNHDVEYGMVKPMLAYAAKHPESRWKMPARWYRLSFPETQPLVCVFMLDTNKSSLPAEQWKAQMEWLQKELSAVAAMEGAAGGHQRPWIVICGHHPLFSPGAHGDSRAMQSELGPLLKKHAVDFHISGHDHILAHVQPEGWHTIFVISGGGGENINRSVKAGGVPFCRAMHGFAHMQFSQRQAVVSFVDGDGQTVYTFRRQRAAASGADAAPVREGRQAGRP